MITTYQRVLIVAALIGATGAGLDAQAQAPSSAGRGQPAPAKQPEPPAPERPAYSYQPEGRRDPFLSLLARGSDPASTSSRPSGLPGLLIAEITVKGIIQDRSGFIAIVQGPDTTKTFTVRNGEHVMDGAVKSISVDTVVFSQTVNDPLSVIKQREVRKAVRPLDDRGVRE
jgi:Tfp pilus assembly protein PilP